MEDLIEALMIFRTYSDTERPTRCEHDVMVVNVSVGPVRPDDVDRLEELGFIADWDEDCFYSFRFGG
jgi:hypothetical protein